MLHMLSILPSSLQQNLNIETERVDLESEARATQREVVVDFVSAIPMQDDISYDCKYLLCSLLLSYGMLIVSLRDNAC